MSTVNCEKPHLLPGRLESRLKLLGKSTFRRSAFCRLSLQVALTIKGKAMGSGIGHFRKEGAKLIPPPTADDPYEDEAYRLGRSSGFNEDDDH